MENPNRQSRASTIKVKINGLCVRCCVFCPFHSDQRRLEIADLVRLFDLLGTWPYYRIVINGGEPSIHPSFRQISEFLKQKFKEKVRLELGTNLVPLQRNTEHWQKIWDEVLTTYDRLQIGCDDQHANIDQVEHLVPQAVAAGLSVAINVVEPYCRDETRRRILALAYRHQVRVEFSRIMHDHRTLPVLHDNGAILCRYRVRDLLVTCDGSVFFCFQQEHERPLFNIREVSDDVARHLLFEHEPGAYAFCRCCDRYEPTG